MAVGVGWIGALVWPLLICAGAYGCVGVLCACPSFEGAPRVVQAATVLRADRNSHFLFRAATRSTLAACPASRICCSPQVRRGAGLSRVRALPGAAR